MIPSRSRALWSALLASSLLLWCPAAAGQDVVSCDPDDAADCVAYLVEGQVAPFSGQLLGPRRAAVLVIKTEQCSARADLAAAEEKERGEVRVAAEQARRDADREANMMKIETMRAGMDAYKTQFEPHWYEHPALWFCTGVLAAVAVTAGAVALLDATRPAVVTVP